MFRVNFGNSSGAFGVPNEVVDQHLKLSGVLSLKVLLLLLRRGCPMEIAELAQQLNQNEGDIKDALNQWVQLGMVVNEEGAKQTREEAPIKTLVVPEAASKEETIAPPMTETAQEEPEEPKKIVLKERFYRMNRHDVGMVSQTDGMVGVLLEESQNILARVLSSGESETLVSLYHHYGMELDIIIMMLQYCKSIGKDSPAYYEKMAIDWVNREINTHEKAERELLRLTEKTKQEDELRKLFGIYNRGITKKELEFYNIWTETFKMNSNMIKLAFEKTVDAKGKMSFHYTNAILKSWFEKGLKTPADAEQESKNTASGKEDWKNQKNSEKSSYDLNQLEKMISEGSVWD